MKLARLRISVAAVALSTAAWAAGCGTPRPMIEPVFAARTYTPARIAILPPAVFMVQDDYGDNDPQKSWQLGQVVTQQTVTAMADELRRRGYDVNLQARWDGVHDGNGQLLVAGNDLGWLANSIVQFANSEVGGGEGPMEAPAFIAPELARRIGWATQSDSLLYVNMKGVAVSSGKRTAQVVGAVLFVAVIAVIIAMLIAQNKGGGRSGDLPAGGSGVAGRSVPRAGGATGARMGGGSASAFASGPGAPTRATVAPVAPTGRGSWTGARGGGRVYRGSPRYHSGVDVGVGLMIPLDSEEHTHDGQVADDDDPFAGDEIHVSMTLVSAYDGRVLWHIRDSVDVEPDRPQEVDAFVRRYVDLLPPALTKAAPAAPAPAPGAAPAPAPGAAPAPAPGAAPAPALGAAPAPAPGAAPAPGPP